MAGSSGAVSGTIWMMPVSAVAFGVASATSLTPGIFSISSARSAIRPSGSVDVTIVPVMMSGPLKPGPKCSDARSYA